MVEEKSVVEPKKKQEILTTKELAARWQMKPKTLEVWRIRGQGPVYFRVGSGPKARVRYKLQEIKRYEAENRPFVPELRYSATERKKRIDSYSKLSHQLAAIAKKSRRISGQRGKRGKKKQRVL